MDENRFPSSIMNKETLHQVQLNEPVRLIRVGFCPHLCHDKPQGSGTPKSALSAPGVKDARAALLEHESLPAERNSSDDVYLELESIFIFHNTFRLPGSRSTLQRSDLSRSIA